MTASFELIVDFTEVPLSLYTFDVPGVDFGLGPPFIEVTSVLEFDPNFRDPSLKCDTVISRYFKPLKTYV